MYKNYTSVNVEGINAQFVKEQNESMSSISGPSKSKYFLGILFLLNIVFIGFQANAQVSSLLSPTYGYTFAKSTSTYTALTAPTVFQSGAAVDNNAVSAAIPLPFTFTYNGIKERSIYISNNGFITFGIAPGTGNTTPISSTQAYDGAIAGFAANLVASSVGTPSAEISYGTNAGNDFVVQYRDVAVVAASHRITFQIILSVDGKTIRIVYGPNNSSTANTAGQVGIRGTNDEDWNLRTIGNSGNWNNASGGNAAIINSDSMPWRSTNTLPSSGLTYTWTPTAYVPTYLANAAGAVQDFTTWVNGSGPANIPSTNWATNGYGDASWQIDNAAVSTTTTGWTGNGGAYSPSDYLSSPTGHSARFNSWISEAGQVGYLDYYVNLSATVGTPTLDFYSINPSGGDKLQVFLSTNGGATFTQIGVDYGVATTWTARSISLGSTNSATTIIRFKGTSDFGNDTIGIDHVVITPPPSLPSITSFTPNTNLCNSGGQTVTITGTSFSGTTSVKFNGVEATSFIIVNNTTITAVTPAMTAGTITITNPAGTATSSAYTIIAGPTIAVTPTPANARICGSGTVSMTASGADTYVWTPTTALAPAAGTSATEVSSATVTTVYTVKGTSTATGCSGTATQTVTVGPVINLAAVSATPSTVCSGATSVLNAVASISSSAYCTPVYSDRDGTDGLTAIALKNSAGTTTLYTRASGLVALPCYDDQTALTTTTLTAGTSYQVSATLNTGSGNVAAFMDFNHDGDFADSGETILANTSVAGSGSISVTFTVPAGAYNGNTRLRIVERFGSSAATSCNTTGYGETEDYTVIITGGGSPLTYSWTPAVGLSPSASVANPTTPALTNDATYNVTVTEPVSGCFVTGSTTVTTTNIAPQITTGPTDQSKCSGQTATFNVGVTGASLSYQWRRGTTNVVNDARISGATTATLIITGLVAGDAGTDYNVVVTSTCGSAGPLFSNNAALILNDITATVSPTSASVCGSQLLTVTTTASPANYVWRRNGAVISSAASATYTATEQGTYSVIVTGGASGCTAPTATAAIFVKANPGAVIMTPSSASVCAGENITLGASASNTNTTILREDFNGSATGWTSINNSTGGVDPALAAWTIYQSDGTASSNDASNFILTNSDAQGEDGTTATILNSPVMDLSAYTNASLSFYQFFRFNGSPDTAKVEVSTNGISWTTLATYTSNQGSALAWVPVSFNLNAYTGPGKTTVYIRFKYDAPWGYYWGIDNVLVTGTSTPTVTWSPTTELYSSLTPLTPYGGEAAGGVFAMPTANRTYTARATAANGCFTEDTISVTPRSLPIFSVSDVSLCSDNALGVDVSPTGGDSANTYIWTPTTGLSGGNIAVDGTTTSVDIVMANPASTSSYSVVANNNTTGCSSPPHSFTVTVSPQAVAAAATPSTRIKSVATSTTFTVSSLNAVAYQWQVKEGSGGFINIDGAYTPVDAESYSGATTATLTINNISELMTGFSYRALVKGGGNCGFVIPSNAQEGVLTVQNIGFVANFPADFTLCESGDASFHIQTTGGTPENYIWQVSRNGGAFINIADGLDPVSGFTYAGSTTADLDVTGVTYSTDSYRYQVSIDDESVTSDFATLHVNKTIVGTQAPQNNSLCSLASTSTMSAKATGTISGVTWEYGISASGPWTPVASGTPSNITYSSSLPAAVFTDGERTATLLISSNATTPVTGGPYFYRAVFQRAIGVCTDFTTTSGQLDITTPVLTSQPVSTSVIVTNSATFTVGISGAATYQWQYSTSPSSGFQDIPTGSQTGASYSGTTSATLTVTTSGTTPFAANNYYRARVTSGGCIVYSNAAQLTVTNYCAPTYANGPGTTNQITRVTLGTLTNNSGPATSPYYTLNTGITIPDLIKFSTNSVQVTMGSDANQYTGVWIDFNQNGTFEASEGVVSSTNAGANGIASLSVTVPSTATLGQTRMRVRGGDDLALLTSQACGATNSVVGETEDYLVNVIATPAPTITSLGSSTACAGTSITINGTNLYGAVASGVIVNGVAVSSITSNTGSVMVVVINPATPAGTGTNLISITAAGGITPGSPTFTVSTAPTAVTVSGGGNTCAASLTLTASNGGSGTIYYQGITSNGTSTTTASSSQAVTTSGTYYFRAQSAGGCWSPQGSATVAFYTTPSAITVTPDAPSVCANGIQALAASGGINVPSSIGTGTTFLALTNEQTAFCNRRTNYVGQTIYTAAELNAAGISAGNITSLSYNISQNGDSQTNANFTVRIGHVGSQAVFGTTAFLSNAGYTTVYGPSTYTHTAPGFQLVTFATPFVWNGTDNICVDVRMDGADSINNARTQFTATGINSSIYGYDSPSVGTLSASRLNILFGYTRPANAFTWTPTTDLYTDSGATIAYTGSPSATVYAKRATTGTYTVTATNPGGCSSTKNVTVTVDVLVGSAITTTGTRCATTNFTATANRTGGGAPFHYAWNDGVGGIYPDAATVTVNKSAGTYAFDVTITDDCGGTTHSTATIVVRGLPTVSITSVTPVDAKICGTGTVSMTATGAVSYAWTPTLGLAPAAGTSATEVSSATSTTPYTVVGTDANGCTNSATQTVTVGPAVARPTVAATTATPATICSGGTSVLTTSSATPAAYLSSLISFAPIASGTGTVTLANAGVATTPLSSGSLDDGYWNGQPLPFSFTYDGTSYAAISVQTNGVVSFTAFSTATGYGSSPQMPNTATPNNIIGVFGDLDWSLGGKISSYTSGSAPNRIYVINYNGTPTTSAGGGFYNLGSAPTALVNYQIQLFENGNKIQIHTTSIASDVSTIHTMGVENAGGTLASIISGRNTAAWTLSNDGVQFAPQNLTYAWTGPNGFASSLQSPTTPVLTANATYSAIATESVSGCSSAARNVTVTVQALPNAGTNGTLTICSGSTVTASQLFASLGGTPQAGGTWTPSLAGAGTYTYTVAATAPCTGNATAQVVVTAQSLPNAGTNGALTICSGTTVTASQLFASLGGTPQAGGTWSPTLAGAGTYTYTVAATAPCTGTATSQVVVTTQALPNAGTDGAYTICSGTNITLAQLQAAITGEDAGGSWSPALGGAGTYTYTVNATSPCATPDTSVVVVSAVSCQSTQLSNCGNTPVLTSVNTRIFAGSTVTQATLYRFRVAVSTAPSTYFYAETAYPSFRLTDVVGLTPTYGTTYNVDIQNEFLISGNTVTSAYGPMCTVSTQAATNITVPTNQCGQTLAVINSKIYVNGVTGATMYTYRIAKQSAPTQYGYIETPYSNFRLTAPLTSGSVAIEHNTVYLVAVSVTTANGSSNFNGECQITTPAGPMTTLQASQCGDDETPYVIPTKSTKVYSADFVSGATYTFKLEQYSGATLVATKYATSPINYFDCNMFTGINSLLPNTNYHVYVAINYYGQGDYDHDCVVKTPAALKHEDIVTDFKAMAYPNPFANNFMIDVKSSSESSVNLKIYDMIGRLIEQRDVRISDLEATTIGDRYPSGVYNVVVSQESSVQTVRVVKR